MADESPASRAHEVVSFDSEELILVDPQDRDVGFRSKAEVHDGEGVLHRAFSLFVFDRRGRVIGVLFGGQRESDGRIVYAVPSYLLAQFLETQGLLRR